MTSAALGPQLQIELPEPLYGFQRHGVKWLAEREHALVVACDMPFLNLGLLQYMARQIEDNDVVIPRMGTIFEPLHSIYSRRCIEPIRRMLAVQNFRVIDLLQEVRVRYIEKEEIDAFDPTHLTFFNINTPDDLEKAQAEYARRYGDERGGTQHGGK